MNETGFHWINDWAGRFGWIDALMTFCAQDIVWVMLAVLAGLWLTGKTANQKAVFFACLTSAVALLAASQLISPAVNHPRPFVGHMVHLLIPHAADPSFPSDHATLAFSLAFSLLFANRRVGLLMLGLALITGISRVYVGVHYPGDILGAMALSLAAAYLVWKLRTRLDRVPAYFIRLYRKLTRHLDFLPRPE